jgi:hypothetical protein
MWNLLPYGTQFLYAFIYLYSTFMMTNNRGRNMVPDNERSKQGVLWVIENIDMHLNIKTANMNILFLHFLVNMYRSLAVEVGFVFSYNLELVYLKRQISC